MGVAGKHVDALDVVAAHLELDHLVGADLPFLDEAVAAHYDEELPFGVMPMLTFGNARFANVDGDLTAVQRMDQLGKRATVVHVHLQREGHFLFREIREIRGVKLLGEAVGRNLGNHQVLGLGGE